MARRKEDIVRLKAKANQQASEGRGQKGLAKLPDLKPVDTRKEVAKAAGVVDCLID